MDLLSRRGGIDDLYCPQSSGDYHCTRTKTAQAAPIIKTFSLVMPEAHTHSLQSSGLNQSLDSGVPVHE